MSETAIATIPVEPLSPEGLIAKAIEHGLTVDTLERLLAMRQTLRAEEARTAFFAALSAFQGECPIIVKDKLVSITPREGRAYSYRYAPLDKIVQQVAPLLQRHGFSFTLNTRHEADRITVICTLHHLAGHSEDSEFTVPIDKTARMNDTQKVGAARTFCMRYAFCNAVGIMTGDEDTDTAEQHAQEKFPRPPAKQKIVPAAEEGPEPERDGSGEAGGSVEGVEGSGAVGRADRPDADAMKRKLRLEAEINKQAEARGIKPARLRDEVKTVVLDRFKREHFIELTPTEHAKIMFWLAARD